MPYRVVVESTDEVDREIEGVYQVRPSFKGSSRNLDTHLMDNKPQSANPLQDYIDSEAKDDKEAVEIFKAKLADTNRQLSEIKDQLYSLKKWHIDQKTGEENTRVQTRLMQVTLILTIFVFIIAPAWNGGIDGSRWLLRLIPGVGKFVPTSSSIIVNKDNNIKSVPSNISASDLVAVMQRKGYKVRTGPGEINIVYVFNPNFPSTINTWSDRRIIFDFKNNQPQIIHDAQATIKGGRPSWLNPPNPKGYPVIIPGQYQAWSVGYHKQDRRRPALVQTESIPVARSKDQGKTWRLDRGLFGINQHSGKGEVVNKWSEGCLVSPEDHNGFMAIVKSDPAYLANPSYRFLTTIININELVSPQIGEKKNEKRI